MHAISPATLRSVMNNALVRARSCIAVEGQHLSVVDLNIRCSTKLQNIAIGILQMLTNTNSLLNSMHTHCPTQCLCTTITAIKRKVTQYMHGCMGVS